MTITIHHHDSSDEYKAQLNSLTTEVFGFSFERWHRRKVWNADYTCYSIIENGVMVANICAYRMDILIGGREQEFIQLGTVAARKARRGEGLSRKIMEFILDRHPHTPFFLCANSTVLDFYPRFGFQRVAERQPLIRQGLDHPGVEMKNLRVDDPVVGEYLEQRAGFSRILDCTNAAPIHWFHLLNSHIDHLYEIPELGVMLVAEQSGSALTLYDVCASRPVSFAQLAPRLHFPGVDTIYFGFNSDWLNVDYQTCAYEADSTLFVRGEVELPREFLLPEMIKT